MTFVVELRDLKKSLPRPVAHFWQRVVELACVLRIRLVLLGLLGLALDYAFPPKVAPSGGAPALLCSVLSAAVSATLGLLGDASTGLYTLFGDSASPLFRLGQRLNLCFGEPVFALDICSEVGSFPTFSGHCTLALVACALFLFSGGVNQREVARRGRSR